MVHSGRVSVSPKPVVMGLIGIGAMGKGLLYQSTITPGAVCGAVCDVHVDRALKTLTWLGMPFDVANTPGEMVDTIRRGRVSVCEDGLWIAGCEALDVMVEASNAVAGAGRHTHEALLQGLPVVLMNSEIDLLYGPLFADTARRTGTTFTSCDGDQYGVLRHLIDEIRGWGFELVMAGNIKGFLDRYATASTVAAEADLRHLDHRMCAAYTDGTKLNIEMAILANAYGLRTSQAGMRGPALNNVHEVLQAFDFDDLRRAPAPAVDYILGAEPGGGVFVVGYCDNAYQRQMLAYYKMGNGPHYLFQRPYHLCHIEAMRTVVEAVRHRRGLMQPTFGFATNVYAYAKRDLAAGTPLDGIGGQCCYGLIENNAEGQDGVPIGLADEVVLTRAVARDEKIHLRDVSYDSSRVSFRLFDDATRASDAIRQQRGSLAGPT